MLSPEAANDGRTRIRGQQTNYNREQQNDITAPPLPVHDVERQQQQQQGRRWWKLGQHLQQQAQPQKEPKNDVKLTIDNYLRSDEANGLSIISANKSQVINSGGNEENGAIISDSMNAVASTSDATPVVAGSSVSTQITQDFSETNNNSIDSTNFNQSQINDGRPDLMTSNASGSDSNQANGNQWILVASQTTQEMRHRMSMASDQLGYSLRQLYASASSITGDVPPSYHNIPGIVPYYHGRSSGPPPSYDDVVNPYAAPPTYQSLFGQMLEARKTSRGLMELLRRLLIISTLGCTMLIALMILIPFTMIIVGAVYMEDCNIEHIPAFLLVGGLVWASKNIIHCYGQCAAQDPSSSSSLSEFGTTTVVDQSNVASSSDDDEHANNGIYTPGSSDNNNSDSGERLNHNGSLRIGIGNSNPTATNQGGGESTPNYQQFQQRQREHRFKSSIAESLLNCVLFGWFIAGCVIVFKNYEPDFENTSSPRYCHRTVYMYTFWLISSAITMFVLFITCICCLMVSSALATREHDDIS